MAEPLLKELKELFDETVHLTVLDNNEVLYAGITASTSYPNGRCREP
jgi:DNA-binding IclR family transcriptional regulator